MQKIYKNAPLPFIGQKRRFLVLLEKILNENIKDDGKGWTIIDVFGGSGLLSHNAKRLKPKATVIYNDYDNYAERLRNIPDINRLRAQIYAAVENVPRKSRLTIEKKAEILQIISQFDGYIDTHTLSTWLMFSGTQIKSIDEIAQKTLYNRTPKKTMFLLKAI